MSLYYICCITVSDCFAILVCNIEKKNDAQKTWDFCSLHYWLFLFLFKFCGSERTLTFKGKIDYLSSVTKQHQNHGNFKWLLLTSEAQQSFFMNNLFPVKSVKTLSQCWLWLEISLMKGKILVGFLFSVLSMFFFVWNPIYKNKKMLQCTSSTLSQNCEKGH